MKLNTNKGPFRTKIIAEVGINQFKTFSLIILFICMIKNTHAETLGKSNQVVSTTRLDLICDECNVTEWSCSQSNRKNRDRDICVGCRNKLGISGMKGKTHTTKFKEGARNRMLKKNPMSSLESRKKISEKLTGRETPWLTGKKRPEHSKKMRKHMLRIWSTDNDYRNKLITSNKKHSQLHDTIKGWLNTQFKHDFISEQPIPETNFIVDEIDFYKKLVLNIHGDYWHCNPNKYAKNEIVFRNGVEKKVSDIWHYDMVRDKILKSKGYDIINIWESDFYNNKEFIIKKLKNYGYEVVTR